MGKDSVVIHIDKNKFNSPSTTTGTALFILGSIDASKYDLFLEIPGNPDDLPIENNTTPVEVKNGSHLYTAQKNLNPG